MVQNDSRSKAISNGSCLMLWRQKYFQSAVGDDTDALAEAEQELDALVESLDKTCTRYKMGISAEKTKLMTKGTNGIQREIKAKGRSWVL